MSNPNYPTCTLKIAALGICNQRPTHVYLYECGGYFLKDVKTGVSLCFVTNSGLNSLDQTKTMQK